MRKIIYLPVLLALFGTVGAMARQTVPDEYNPMKLFFAGSKKEIEQIGILDFELLKKWILEIRMQSRLTEDAIFAFHPPGDGYTRFVGNLMKGKTKSKRLKDFVQEKDPAKRKQISEELAGNYKIHLMPKGILDVYTILQRLIKELNSNKKFGQSVNQFKIVTPMPFGIPDHLIEEYLRGRTSRGRASSGRMPSLVVIYPSYGKENAQFVLDTIYSLFKDLSGLDIAPSYNRKVTSLIYFAQGNGDDKTDQDDKKYFSQNRVYYNPKYIKASGGNRLKLPSKVSFAKTGTRRKIPKGKKHRFTPGKIVSEVKKVSFAKKVRIREIPATGKRRKIHPRKPSRPIGSRKK